MESIGNFHSLKVELAAHHVGLNQKLKDINQIVARLNTIHHDYTLKLEEGEKHEIHRIQPYYLTRKEGVKHRFNFNKRQ